MNNSRRDSLKSITNGHLLICDYGFQSSEGLRSEIQIVTKDVVKFEV